MKKTILVILGLLVFYVIALWLLWVAVTNDSAFWDQVDPQPYLSEEE